MTGGERAVELARELIAIDTTTTAGNENACAVLLGNLLDGNGFSVRYFTLAPGRTSLVAYLGNGKGKPLCLTGHLDTVPFGQASWSLPPLSATVSDGKLFGRGAADMKSGVAALVIAAIASKAVLAANAGALIVLTAGEETGCEGAFNLVASGADVGRAGAIVVAEPTDNQPLLGHKGALWLKISVTGKAAHGSMPESGENAILHGAYLAEKLGSFRFRAKAHAQLGKPSMNVGTFVGGTGINMVPDYAELGIDIRTTPGMEHGCVVEKITHHLQSHNCKIERLLDLPNVWTNPRHPWIETVFGLLGTRFGERPDVRGATYFTDACVLGPANGNVPIVILGPGKPEMAHQTDEYCELLKIHDAVSIYEDMLGAWGASPSYLSEAATGVLAE